MSDPCVITGISNEATNKCVGLIQHRRAGFRLCLVTVDHGETYSFGLALGVSWLATLSTDVAIGKPVTGLLDLHLAGFDQGEPCRRSLKECEARIRLANGISLDYDFHRSWNFHLRPVPPASGAGFFFPGAGVKLFELVCDQSGRLGRAIFSSARSMKPN